MVTKYVRPKHQCHAYTPARKLKGSGLGGLASNCCIIARIKKQNHDVWSVSNLQLPIFLGIFSSNLAHPTYSMLFNF